MAGHVPPPLLKHSTASSLAAARAGCSCARCHLPEALLPPMLWRRVPTSGHLWPGEELIPHEALVHLEGDVPADRGAPGQRWHWTHSTDGASASPSRSGTRCKRPGENKEQLHESQFKTRPGNKKKSQRLSPYHGPGEGLTTPCNN